MVFCVTLGNVAVLDARKQARRYAGGSEPSDLLGVRAVRYRTGDSSGDGVSEERLEALDISAVFAAFPLRVGAEIAKKKASERDCL